MGKPDHDRIIEEARAIVRAMRARHQSDNTVKQYAEHWQRMDPNPLTALDNANCAATFHVRQCAAKYTIAVQLEELLQRYDREDDAIRRQLMVEIADRFVLFGEVEFKRYRKKTRRRKSKRNLLSTLPADWPDQLMIQAAQDSQAGYVEYLREVMFLAVSGCRVGELSLDTYAHAWGNALRIRIEGEKVTDHSGQPSRVLYFDPASSMAAQLLFNEAGKRDGLRPRSYLTEGTIREYIRRLGVRRFDRDDLTPGLFRQRLASILKAEGDDRGIVAAALGHISDRTAGRYGLFGQAKGSSGLLRAETARQVIMHQSGHEKFLAPAHEEEDLD